MTRTAPILTLTDGRAMHGITPHQARALEAVVLRYYAWQASDRAADPWASGVGKAIRYDVPRVQHGAPPGGYGPGVATDGDDADPLLPRVHEAVRALPEHHRHMLVWRWLERQTMDQMADRLQFSPKVTLGEWRRLLTNLYYSVWGG